MIYFFPQDVSFVYGSGRIFCRSGSVFYEYRNGVFEYFNDFWDEDHLLVFWGGDKSLFLRVVRKSAPGNKKVYDFDTLTSLEQNEVHDNLFVWDGIKLLFSESGSLCGLLNPVNTKKVYFTSSYVPLLMGEYFAIATKGDGSAAEFQLDFYRKNLDLLWTKRLQRKSYLDVRFSEKTPNSRVFVSQGLFIFLNDYDDTDGNRVYSVRALSVENGADVWELSVSDKFINSLWVDGDQACIASGGVVYLIDVVTGQVKYSFSPVSEQDPSPLIAQHDDEFLYCLHRGAPTLKVFTRDGLNLVKEVALPVPVCLRTDRFAVLDGDRLYFSLLSTTDVRYALMVLEKSDLRSPDVVSLEFETGPEVDVQCVKNIDDSDHYEIVVRGDDVLQVRRFATVAVLDVLSRFTRIMIFGGYPEEYNEDYNGIIHLKLAGVPAAMRSDEHIGLIRSEIKQQLDFPRDDKQLKELHIEWID